MYQKGEASDLRSKSDPCGRNTVAAYPLCGALPRNAPPEGLGPSGPPVSMPKSVFGLLKMFFGLLRMIYYLL
jgi:hypothetical protein